MAQLTTLGIDTAKQVFQLHGGDQQGNVVLRKHISRKQVSAFETRPPLVTILIPMLLVLDYCCHRYLLF